MPVKNTLIKLLVAAAVLVPAAVAAQTSSINAFSPYTMYGIGELNTQGTLAMRSMGGVGVAMRNAGVMNLLNPAAYSTAPQKPYSSVGYRTKFYHQFDPSDPVAGNIGAVQYGYQGEGDVTEVKVGIGWEIFKNFSIGIAAQYYWGDIDRNFVMTPTTITGEGNFASMVGNDNYNISSVKGQVGVQWNAILTQQRILTLGAAFDFGGDLSPEVTSRVYNSDINYTTVRGDTTHLALVLPRQLTAGVFYQTSKWALGVDYTFQNWGGRNKRTEMTGISGAAGSSYEVAYTDTHTIKVGAEFTPNRYDVRHLLKRWSYRAGFRYGIHNQTFNGHQLAQYAATLGIGIPVRFFSVSAIDVGVEYGSRGANLSKGLGLVRQQYFKFALGFTLFAGGAENNEYWFSRPKYD